MNETSASGVEHWFPRGPFVASFRKLLDRRGASDLEIVRAAASDAIHCAKCFGAAAAALGLAHERIDLAPDELREFGRYTELRWGLQRGPILDADDPQDEHVVATGTDDGDSLRVRFLQPNRYGLFRLGGIYYWSFEHGDRDEGSLIVGTKDTAAFERLVADAERRHAAHERARRGMILIGDARDRRRPIEPVSWNDVLLPRALRQDLEKTVTGFFASRELYRRHRLSYRRGVLLAGPPGNGKTTIVRAIQNSAGVPLILASGPLEEHRQELLVQRAFHRAATLAPSILCFEDVDGLVELPSMLSLFLNLLDGLEPLEGVLVIATTNKPEKIDPAIARRPSRFDRVFLIPPPDRALRQAYFARAFGQDTAPDAAARLAAETDGLSVAFLKEIVVQARLAAVARGEDRLRAEDLEQALASVQEHVRLAENGLEDHGDFGFEPKTSRRARV